ncbi:hypothetical protein QRX50_13380 [Amycolatopsis carbonis]|uniref:Uncharacterized protein n=1 Tax=Amycolatopsis carbonis TaxID=715471 RepID=A0A9Y2ILW8_9PSEU|nr:hypothetical protein [Amycolatopsis sp. 2-15]WIX81676.1 hypothetical protein QRX50_13380 [Amycolatopsis sp. 2-15]
MAAVVLMAGTAFVLAWALTWVVGIVHDWWPTVPTMPYGVAAQICLAVLVGVVMSSFLASVAKWALSKSRKTFLTRGRPAATHGLISCLTHE